MIVVVALLAVALTGPAPISSLGNARPSHGHAGPAAATVEARVPTASPSSLVQASATSVVRAPGWDWPLSGPRPVVRPFDPPPLPWQPGHRGVDLAGVAGERVLAAGPGVVAFAGTVAGRGVVSVDHAGGLRTTYEPVSATVRRGDVVGLGSPLGTLDVGHPGCPTSACLHWGLRRGGVYLNPLVLLRPLRVRLKPLSAAPLGAGVGALTLAGPAARAEALRAAPGGDEGSGGPGRTGRRSGLGW